MSPIRESTTLVAAPNLSTIPDELKELDRWIIWEATRKPDGGLSKIPKSVASGQTANAHDERSQGSFETAMHAMDAYEADGVALDLDESMGLVGVDLDHCVDAAGKVHADAMAVVRAIDSYTEFSPSRQGLRIFAFGGLPPDCRTKAGDLEMYTDGRFLTVTGWHLPGTPTTVQYRDFELRDVAARLLGTRSAGNVDVKPEAFDPGSPPVRLHPVDLQLWRGERTIKKHATGTPDRSATLWAIAMLLARSGVTPRVIAEAAAERDVSLGFRKYSSRQGGGQIEYRRMAQAAWDAVEREPKLFSKTPEERELKARLAEALERAERAERLLGEQLKKDGFIAGVLSNPALRPQERIVAVAAINEVVIREEHGETREDGYVPAYLASIAERSGCSADTAGRSLKAVVETGVIEKTTEQEGLKTKMYLRLPGEPDEALAAAASAAPERPRHGGDRPRCPDHPNARVIERVTRHCEDCGQRIGAPFVRIYEDVDAQLDTSSSFTEGHLAPLCDRCDDQLDTSSSFTGGQDAPLHGPNGGQVDTSSAFTVPQDAGLYLDKESPAQAGVLDTSSGVTGGQDAGLYRSATGSLCFVVGAAPERRRVVRR